MGRITDEDIQRVRDATDLVSLIGERIVLKPKGRLQWGLCPFHGEKTPSFKVDPATQLWHCFGCGLGGDAFGFVMKTDNVEFPEAVRLLADRAHIELAEEAAGGMPRGRKERLYAALDEAAAYYARMLTGSREPGPEEARRYLGGRGFGSEVAKSWRLGFAPGRGALVRHLREKGFSADELVDANLALKGDHGLKDRFYERVMFPISDLQGRVIAFGGRVIGKGEPKYLNTNDTPVFRKSANMYAIDRAKAAITSTGTAVVVEGYTDVIALHEAGITSAVATLGTALTKQHVKLLGRFAKQVVYLFDGDEAGMRAADRASEFIDASVTPEAGSGRVDLLVAVIPDGLDPADYVAEKGADAMRAVVAGAVPLLRFSIDRRLARWDLERPEERSRALKDAVEVLGPVRDSLLADDYAAYIADRLFADFAVVRRELDKVKVATPGQHEEAVGETPDVSVAGLTEPTTPQGRIERTLLALLVREPRLRCKAQELLAEDLLSDPEHRVMAEEIARDESLGMSPSELIGRLESRVPGVAAALSGAEENDDEKQSLDDVAYGLVRRLKEFDLERRITVGKARLKQAGSFKDDAEYDEVFREVSALQRALDALRRGVDEYR